MSKRFDSSLLFSVDDLIESANCHAVIVDGSADRPNRIEIYEAGCSPEDQGDGPVTIRIVYRKSSAIATVSYGQWSCEVRGLLTVRELASACSDYVTLDEFMDAVMSEYGVEEVGDDREDRALNAEYMRNSGVWNQ